MTLWISFAALLLVALMFLAWPLYRSSGRLTPVLGVSIVFVVALSAGLYQDIGSPGVESGAGAPPDINEMVASLATRLENNPDDVDGWQMLGRSYQKLQQFDKAIASYEKAIVLEGSNNPQTLVALALTVMEADGGNRISMRANGLLESALALDGNNPNALFYAGFAAASRGDTALAANRWEILMGLNAPPEIRNLLQQKIDEWRGTSTVATPSVVEQAGAVATINVSVADAAKAALPDEATVYVIARDPEQPSPPIAVARRRLSELPVSVDLGDADSMVPGRSLSAFPKFEIVTRVSLSGRPVAQSGDWFGSLLFEVGNNTTVDLIVDQQVP